MHQLRVESDHLKTSKFSHGFFTRCGGVSTGVYQSLNCGFGSNDDKGSVAENRAIVLRELQAETHQLITPYQQHTTNVVIAEHGWEPDKAPVADAIVTTVPQLAIGILTADCAPVLFMEPEAGIIGAAHAGWRGALGGVLENVIDVMTDLGGTKENILATVGPTISVKHYEIGPEFMDVFIRECGENEKFFVKNEDTNKFHFNLTGFIISRLKSKGLNLVDTLNYCTYENESLFFSYRRNFHNSIGDYGRQISAIIIN